MSAHLARVRGSLSSGWFFKAGPANDDRDKKDTLTRRLRIAGGALKTQLQGLNIGKGNMTRRFFALEGKSFHYYKDEDRRKHLGTIDLSGGVKVVATSRELAYGIDIVRQRGSLRPVAPATALPMVLFPRFSRRRQITPRRTYTIAPCDGGQHGAWISVLSDVAEVRGCDDRDPSAVFCGDRGREAPAPFPAADARCSDLRAAEGQTAGRCEAPRSPRRRYPRRGVSRGVMRAPVLPAGHRGRAGRSSAARLATSTRTSPPRAPASTALSRTCRGGSRCRVRLHPSCARAELTAHAYPPRGRPARQHAQASHVVCVRPRALPHAGGRVSNLRVA